MSGSVDQVEQDWSRTLDRVERIQLIGEIAEQTYAEYGHMPHPKLIEGQFVDRAAMRALSLDELRNLADFAQQWGFEWAHYADAYDYLVDSRQASEPTFEDTLKELLAQAVLLLKHGVNEQLVEPNDVRETARRSLWIYRCFTYFLPNEKSLPASTIEEPTLFPEEAEDDENTATPSDLIAPQDWLSTLEEDERWAVLERTYLAEQAAVIARMEFVDTANWQQLHLELYEAAEGAARELLAHPVVRRLSMRDFSKLAELLNDGVSWGNFLHTWEAIEAATQRPTNVEEVVNQLLFRTFWVHNEVADPAELTYVSDADEMATYYQAIARLGEAFGIEEPTEVKFSEEERQRYDAF